MHGTIVVNQVPKAARVGVIFTASKLKYFTEQANLVYYVIPDCH